MVISIKIEESEKLQLLKAVRKMQKESHSIREIALEAGLNPNRTRFIMDALVDEGRVEKVVVKKFNDRFIRYKYVEVKK